MEPKKGDFEPQYLYIEEYLHHPKDLEKNYEEIDESDRGVIIIDLIQE